MSYYPSLRTYAALRMDAVATVSSVPGADEEALEAARAIRQKTYLVYIHMVSRSISYLSYQPDLHAGRDSSSSCLTLVLLLRHACRPFPTP